MNGVSERAGRNRDDKICENCLAPLGEHRASDNRCPLDIAINKEASSVDAFCWRQSHFGAITVPQSEPHTVICPVCKGTGEEVLLTWPRKCPRGCKRAEV